jgi:uncharacterized protein (TIGR02001 family)
MKYLLALVAFAAFPAFAEISGSVGATSQYVFRGISQGEDPAIQVGATVSAENFYASFWASQVELDRDVHTEGNYSFGVKAKGFDVGFLQYDYYGDDLELSEESQELYVGYSAGPFTAYAFQDLDTKDNYYNVSASHSFPLVDVSVFAGHAESYDHGGVKISRSFGKFNLGYTFDYLRDASEHSVGLFYNF